METQANPVNWFEISVEDMDRARKFYSHVFQTEITDMPTDNMGEVYSTMQMANFPMTMQAAPNAAGALVKSQWHKPAQNGTLVYFHCNDCNDALSRVEEAGGKVVMPKSTLGQFGFAGVFQDSEGNTVGVHSNA